jgi:hypothetical protein
LLQWVKDCYEEQHWNSAFSPRWLPSLQRAPIRYLAGVLSSYKLAVRLIKKTDFHVSVKELEDEGSWIMKRQFRVSIQRSQSYWQLAAPSR